jgi:hypothetical protein
VAGATIAVVPAAAAELVGGAGDVCVDAVNKAALVDEVVNIDVDAEVELEVKNVEKVVAFWLRSSAAAAKRSVIALLHYIASIVSVYDSQYGRLLHSLTVAREVVSQEWKFGYLIHGYSENSS